MLVTGHLIEYCYLVAYDHQSEESSMNILSSHCPLRDHIKDFKPATAYSIVTGCTCLDQTTN